MAAFRLALTLGAPFGRAALGGNISGPLPGDLRLATVLVDLVGLLVAAATALSCYAFAVWLGEGRGASELALRLALPGPAAGAALGLALMQS